MSEKKILHILLEEKLKEPAYIIRRDGIVEVLNSTGAEFIPGLQTGSNLFNSADGSIKEILKKVFERGEELTELVSKEFDNSGIKNTLIVSPVEYEKSEAYQVTFLRNREYGLPELLIYSKEVEKLIVNKFLLTVIEKVKNSYPFTFIGKAKIKSETEKFNESFWIKDSKRKFITANSAFAEESGTDISGIEGRKDEQLGINVQDNFKTAVEEFVIESGNTVIYSSDKINDRKEVLIMPITDIDDNTVAMLGLSVTTEKETQLYSLLSNDKNIQKVSLEKMYDILMHRSPEAMFVYDLDNLKFLDVNDKALKLYGYSRNEFLQMDLTDLYAPEDLQTLVESSGKRETENGFTGPWRHKKKSGDSVIVEMSKIPIDYQNNKSHLGIIRDVGDKLENEKKLQSFKAVFDNTNDLVIITDKEGFITYSNNSVKITLGYSKSDLEDRPILSILSDSYRGTVNSKIFHSGSNASGDLVVEIKKSDNDLVKSTLKYLPVTDYTGEIESYTIVIQPEENETKTIIKEVPAKQNTHTTKDAIDSSFLSNLFHELLTPINVIIGFAQDISESIENPTADQKEASEIIRENQKVLMQIMDTAAEYAALEQDKIQLNPSEFRFIDTLEEIEDNVKKSFNDNSKVFNLGKISSSLSVETDKSRLITLLVLLLKFACRITKEKNIFISAQYYNDKFFSIAVKDQKTGISNELSKGLSEVFSIDENEVRRKFGLSRFTVRLINKLLEILSGKIEVLQRGSSGSEFAVVMPLEFNDVTTSSHKKKEKEPDVPVISSKEPKKEKTDNNYIERNIPEKEVEQKDIPATRVFEEKEIETPELNKPQDDDELIVVKSTVEKPPKEDMVDFSKFKSLYIEDQTDSQILFKSQMRDTFNKIDFANSFEEALPKIESVTYDIIFIDMNLQGEYNGLDALRIIRKMKDYKEAPLVAVTAYVMPGDRENFIEAGFSEFISKPLMKEKVKKVLTNIFS